MSTSAIRKVSVPCGGQHIARGNEDIVGLLLARDDIDANIADLTDKLTPLGVAVAEGHTEIVRSLLAMDRINVNREDRCGHTPVFHAISNNDKDMLQSFPCLGCPAYGLHAILSSADPSGRSSMTDNRNFALAVDQSV